MIFLQRRHLIIGKDTVSIEQINEVFTHSEFDKLPRYIDTCPVSGGKYYNYDYMEYHNSSVYLPPDK